MPPLSTTKFPFHAEVHYSNRALPSFHFMQKFITLTEHYQVPISCRSSLLQPSTTKYPFHAEVHYSNRALPSSHFMQKFITPTEHYRILTSCRSSLLQPSTTVSLFHAEVYASTWNEDLVLRGGKHKLLHEIGIPCSVAEGTSKMIKF